VLVASVPSWLWLVAGWSLIAMGLWALITARGIKRRHGGRRCQKCGYDMAGIDTLMCPECGKVAANEAELAKGLRRWPWRVAGVGLIVLGWAVMQTPGVAANGWAAAVPGPLLARIAPTDLSTWAQANRTQTPATLGFLPVGSSMPPRNRPSTIGRTASMSTTTAPASDCGRYDRVCDALFDETWRRLQTDSLGEASSVAYLRRVLKLSGSLEEYQAMVPMPPAWAVSAPAPNPGNISGASPGGHSFSIIVNVSSADKPASSLRVTLATIVGTTRHTLAQYDHPVTVQQPRATLMHRVQSGALNQAVAEALAPRLIVGWQAAWVEVDDRAGNDPWNLLTFFAHVRLRVLLEGKELGHSAFSVDPPHRVSSGRIAVLMAWEDGGMEVARARPLDLVYELTGDPAGAADLYMRSWNESQVKSVLDAWTGTVTVKNQKVYEDDKPRPARDKR